MSLYKVKKKVWSKQEISLWPLHIYPLEGKFFCGLNVTF